MKKKDILMMKKKDHVMTWSMEKRMRADMNGHIMLVHNSEEPVSLEQENKQHSFDMPKLNCKIFEMD